MRQKILTALTALTLVLTPALVPTASASAACSKANTAKGQVQRGIGATGSECDDSGVNKFIRAIVQILSIIVGVAAIIMIIVAGFKYMTSAGDSNKVEQAKNTLVYAIVGIIIAALAQFLVKFVLHEASSAVR